MIPFAFACGTSTYSLSVPANDAIVLNYDLESQLEIRNDSKTEIELIKIIKPSGEEVEEFALSPNEEATIEIATKNSLRLENSSNEKATLRFKVESR